MTFPLIAALRGEPHDRVPCWFMRQAGRYLPGYQKIRKQVEFLDLCKDPQLAAEVTVEPLETFGMDAVIIFSDILVPLEAMGLEVEFGDRGPCMTNPIDSRADIDKLRIPDPANDVGYVLDVIREVKKAVGGRVPVLGFAGAPWTLACYALEGSPSRTFSRAFRMLYEDRAAFDALQDKLVQTISVYLQAQIDAGADAVQLFDTWGGMVASDEFPRVSVDPCRRILSEVSGAPRILFIKGAGAHMEQVITAGAEAIGVDPMQNLADVRDLAAGRVALQGNLAPESLFGPVDEVLARAEGLLTTMKDTPGYVFNLGHGILPPTPIPTVKALVDYVHSFPGPK